MYDYIIATSSTSDLPRTYLEAHNIPFIPYTYTIGNDLYEDDCREETRQKVYEGMRNGDRLKTSMINEYIYDEFFESLLAQGKDVVFLDMSQKMSVSYEKSKIGAKMALEKYPERKLYVMDTLCISGGLGLLVDSMVTLAEGGAGYDEVIAWGEANKLKIAHRFTVDDLNYLKAGGRPTAARWTLRRRFAGARPRSIPSLTAQRPTLRRSTPMGRRYTFFRRTAAPTRNMYATS